MSQSNLPTEKDYSQKFNVSFPVEPPAKIDTIPREFLYPFYLVMTVVVLIVLVTTKFFVSLVILGIIAGICYAGYKKFNQENVESQKLIEDTFFVPFEEQLASQGIKLSRQKIAYLWNYDSVIIFSAPFSFRRVSLINHWNFDAIIGVEEDIKVSELLPK